MGSLLLATAAVVALHAWEGDIGFNLWDEGFLWYGAQRVLLGEVPIRDFMAYDPGRYYWSAGYMWLAGGSGLMTLREGVALFQLAGLCAGLWLVARAHRPGTGQVIYLLLSALTLAVWMVPRHKLFDASLSMLLVAALAGLAGDPTSRRCFVAGLCVGLAAVFGRNHGVYGLAAGLGIMAWLRMGPAQRPAARSLLFLAAGIVVGFSPVLAMALMVPGFAGAFCESVRFLFEVRATNLPLPIPWPWRTDSGAIGLFLIALPAFGIGSLVYVTRQRLLGKTPPPALVAAAFLALPYAHYAYSRADIGHVALGSFPMLIGTLSVLAHQHGAVKWSGALLLAGSSLWTAHAAHPGWQCAATSCVTVAISGAGIEVDPQTARDVAVLRDLDAQLPPSRPLVVTPFWPGAYALLRRKAPMWEIYALFPRTPDFERAEIARLNAAQPALILLLDQPLDGREELRFRNTHPLTYGYFANNFVADRLDAERIVFRPGHK